MSMHEYESLVEAGIHLVDQSGFEDKRKRELIFELFLYQAQFDTSYTHFRVIEILKKYDFVRVKKVEECKLGEGDAALSFEEGWNSLQVDDDEELFLFIENGECYYDWNSPVWELLEGEGCAYEEGPISQLALAMMKLAAKADDIQQVNNWYCALVQEALWDAGEIQGEEDLKAYPELGEAKALAVSEGIFAFESRERMFSIQNFLEHWEERSWLFDYLCKLPN